MRLFFRFLDQLFFFPSSFFSEQEKRGKKGGELWKGLIEKFAENFSFRRRKKRNKEEEEEEGIYLSSSLLSLLLLLLLLLLLFTLRKNGVEIKLSLQVLYLPFPSRLQTFSIFPRLSFPCLVYLRWRFCLFTTELFAKLFQSAPKFSPCFRVHR